ncbi:MBL fold metallo-hydrolase [Peribacillus alkalitolerans]|uniref:MBL fold metallo-hydrolase n=1 Tax=Peribacillus alkalitolerans TaxID=1550385 RepID=UPI001968594D|nr:MBL fold metallo-hydrolase [Peribacillus alkalitolerans]
MKAVKDLGNNIFLIDCHDLQRKERTGSYVLRDEQNITLIESSASPSVPYILDGLRELHISPEQVSYLIVTHIHLDHAGGAGLLLKECPNAKIIVHSNGARHLEDPTRLIAGARAVYKDDFNRLFDPIIPIEHSRIIIKKDREALFLSPTRTLTFYDTPGHANHHFSILDNVSNGIFTGDTAGVYYQELKQNDIDLYLPSTSPNQFNPEAMVQSLNLYKELGVNSIFFGHFGMTSYPEEVYKQISHWIPLFLEATEEGVNLGGTFEDQSQAVYQLLMKKVQSHLEKMYVRIDHPVYEILQLDLHVCAMGLVDYYHKKQS